MHGWQKIVYNDVKIDNDVSYRSQYGRLGVGAPGVCDRARYATNASRHARTDSHKTVQEVLRALSHGL